MLVKNCKLVVENNTQSSTASFPNFAKFRDKSDIDSLDLNVSSTSAADNLVSTVTPITTLFGFTFLSSSTTLDIIFLPPLACTLNINTSCLAAKTDAIAVVFGISWNFVVENNQEIIRDILIEDGVITKIDENIQAEGHEIVDAQSNYVLPGIIDVHTHMRYPGLTHKEHFTSGSKPGAIGGVTTFIDMPITIPGTVIEKALMDKKDMMVVRSYVDYGFHFGGSKKDNSEEIKKVLDKVASTKIFLNMSTGDMLIENELCSSWNNRCSHTYERSWAYS